MVDPTFKIAVANTRLIRLRVLFERNLCLPQDTISSNLYNLGKSWLIYRQSFGIPSGYTCSIEVDYSHLNVCFEGNNGRART